jgi:hypothetical protein
METKQHKVIALTIQGIILLIRFFKNVKLLQEKYPEYFNQYVDFNSVLHNRNNVEPTFWFIKDNFGKAPKIAPLNTLNNGLCNNGFLDLNKFKKLS